MKILLAPDKFKGSLSAEAVCEALTQGLKADSDIEIISCPLADGGEGSLEVLKHYLDLEDVVLTIHDPLMRPIQAKYKKKDHTAFIEMSAASGLSLLKEEERNGMLTTSFGTGELIKDALIKGANEIYLFIGGSATNDGGIGIAQALGYRFFNSGGLLLAPIGENLLRIDKIDDSELCFDPSKVKVKVVCDVKNLFYGENGAAFVYAPQKGANPKEVQLLDQGLQNLANRLKAQNYPLIADIPGSGAAGGVGGGAIAFLGAELKSGIELFLELTQFESKLKSCDLVITGEGKLDSQTVQGKVISGVCQLAQKNAVPILAVCGDADAEVGQFLGIQKVYSILKRSKSIQESMEKAFEKLSEIGRAIAVEIR